MCSSLSRRPRKARWSLCSSQSARLAHRALRLQSHRRSPGQGRGALMSASLTSTAYRGSDCRIFRLRKRSSRLTNSPVWTARAGDEIHRRSDGRRPNFGEAFIKSQSPAGTPCPITARLHQRQAADKPPPWKSPANSTNSASACSPPAAPRRPSPRPVCRSSAVNKVTEGRPSCGGHDQE